MQLDNNTIMQRLTLPDKRLDMVLDTDAYNEVDDQFALAYCLLAPERLSVQAIYAAPFLNTRARSPEDGMEQSYHEILRLMCLMGRKPDKMVYRGSRTFMQGESDIPSSDAAEDLVQRAMARPADEPLYVVAIGAITNVAAALRMRPEIARHIVVIWLGGHALYWPDTREFNLRQDVPAARTVLDAGMPLLLVPCLGVSSHMLVSLYELRACLGGANALCDALVALVEAYTADPFAWTKPLWDVAAIAALINPAWAPGRWVHSPLIGYDCQWIAGGESRHIIRVVERLDRNSIFRDLYTRLRNT